jgi:hypothetical protein
MKLRRARMTDWIKGPNIIMLHFGTLDVAKRMVAGNIMLGCGVCTLVISGQY